MAQRLTSDGHMNLGHSANVPMPDRFGPTGDADVVPQSMSAHDADELDNKPFHAGEYGDD